MCIPAYSATTVSLGQVVSGSSEDDLGGSLMDRRPHGSDLVALT